MLKHYLSSNVTPEEEINLEIGNAVSNQDVMDLTDEAVAEKSLPDESYQLLGKYEIIQLYENN